MPQASQEKFPKAVVVLKNDFVPTGKARSAIECGPHGCEWHRQGMSVKVIPTNIPLEHPTLIITQVEGTPSMTLEEFQKFVQTNLAFVGIDVWAYTMELLAGTTAETTV